MKKSIALFALASIALVASVSIINSNTGLNENAVDAYDNIGVNLKRVNIGTSEEVDVSRTFVQYGTEGERQFVRFATAISGPIKSVKYTRIVEGLGTKEKEVTTVYKGIQSAGGVYYYDGTGVVTSQSEATDNYYWACYTIEFTSDTYKSTDITAYITVESNKAEAEVVESTPKTESFEDLKQQADSTIYINNDQELNEFREAVSVAGAYVGKTVMLMNDVNIEGTFITIAEGNDIVLDLNGHTINAALVTGSTVKHIYAFKNYGKLTIKNGTINARGTYNYGEVIVESGVINAIDGDGGYAFRNYNGAKLTLNGGTLATTLEDDHKSDEGGYDATPVQVDDGATFVMNGGNRF